MFHSSTVYTNQHIIPLKDTSALHAMAIAADVRPPATATPGRAGWPFEVSMSMFNQITCPLKDVDIPIFPFFVGDVATQSLSHYGLLLRVSKAVFEWNNALTEMCRLPQNRPAIIAACKCAEEAWLAVDSTTAEGTTGTVRKLVQSAQSKAQSLCAAQCALAPLAQSDLRTLALSLQKSSLINRPQVLSDVALAQSKLSIAAAVTSLSDTTRMNCPSQTLQAYVDHVTAALEWCKHCIQTDIDPSHRALLELHTKTLQTGNIPSAHPDIKDTVIKHIAEWGEVAP